MQDLRLVGVWIDHRRANIVELHGEDVREQEIMSTIERHTHSTGGTKLGGTPYISAMGASERHQHERRLHEMTTFYTSVMAALGDADQIALLGPGLAKGELRHVLDAHQHFTGRIISTKTSAALTPRQLVAEVKSLFYRDPRRQVVSRPNQHRQLA